MTQYLHLGTSLVPYQIRESTTAKAWRMSFLLDGQVEVTVPRGYTQAHVEDLLHTHAGWIVKRRQVFEKFTHPGLSHHDLDHFKMHKQQALQFCEKKVEERNEKRQFDYRKITVKRMKYMWGSCSSKKNLNFNYKIMFLPERMADYVIVHELCHLQHMNHGKYFRSLVADVFGPDYKLYHRGW